MYLRFLSSQGRCAASLEAAIPSVAGWSRARLVRYLARDDVERIIEATGRGRYPRRDRAIVLLLCRLGLRAGDVAGLRLNDFEWHHANVSVCGKGKREALLPLTQEIGGALVDYIVDERPPVARNHLFLCGRAPFGPLGLKSTVSSIVRQTVLRAGVDTPSRGAHILRHSAATHMLRNGASLQDIATILRHRSIDTTMQYAKVDTAALGRIAQAWPEVTPC